MTITSYDLIRSTNVTRLLGHRNEQVQEATRLIDILKGSSITQYVLEQRWSILTPKAAVSSIDAECWEKLMDEGNFLSYLSAKRREEFRKQIAEKKTPEFTEENIESSLMPLIENSREEFAEAICEVFRGLSWDYKTNNPVKFGGKIIVSYMFSVSHWDKNSPPSYNYGGNWDKVNDLVRIFRLLAEEPLLPREMEAQSMVKKLNMQWSEWSEMPDHHIAVKPYKNGNGHIKFLRMDLVVKMNKIMGGRYPGALPAPK